MRELPQPFVKWAGGKTKLLPQMAPYFPDGPFDYYVEPFVGGGAVFFYLYRRGMLQGTSITLSDSCDELMNTYEVVSSEYIDPLVDQLAYHQRNHSKEHYYAVRDGLLAFWQLNNVERAARFIYLNKTCFNGLYRVNSDGKFNTPMGRYVRPTILDEDNLRLAGIALRIASLRTNSFRALLPSIGRTKGRSFFYLDPPYDGAYDQYTPIGFGIDEQERLSEQFKRCDEAGHLLMLSNADTPFIRELYSDYHIVELMGSNAINSDGKGRGRRKELLVMNYRGGDE